ncbi:hypothetical protein AK812_SmicGene4144 [Symbiodinium microadriaticum]|uniref:Uncharacterized protein n=1 Tax=Symbiodinium microadriaticum TaxID=2951 RepID=A0A1Q9EX12_SYMMI|nr:hypothetical protein AK812_SmicGene4144 [Symbiodinium microadriaticum]
MWIPAERNFHKGVGGGCLETDNRKVEHGIAPAFGLGGFWAFSLEPGSGAPQAGTHRLQAQDEQIRAFAMQQLTDLVKNLALATAQNVAQLLENPVLLRDVDPGPDTPQIQQVNKKLAVRSRVEGKGDNPKGKKGDKEKKGKGKGEGKDKKGKGKAAPKPPSNQPTTKGNAEKGAGKGIRTFLEGAYFAMPSLALPFVQPEDKVYWLLDSGSSYHVVSKQTLETGHVKILSKRKMPKTVCQTATGDLVEVGSDTHATIEVNFLTTRPLEKQGDVLSTFACTCRLEAIVSDQIRHNLINLNLLCWKGWKPTLYEGLLTAEQKGITLITVCARIFQATIAAMNPATKWKIKAPRVEEDTCDPLLTSALSREEWDQVGELMPKFVPPYTVPEGILPALRERRDGWASRHRESQQGSGQLGERRGRPQLIISPARFSDNERLQMCLQGYLPKFSDEQIRVVQERVLQTEWYHSQGKYQGPVPLESEMVPGESSAAPSKSLTTAAGMWTAEPPQIKGKTASSGTPVAKEKATSSGTPVAKEKATSSAAPVAKDKATAQRAVSAGATMERPKKRLRQHPWPDTIGVARTSTAALEGARPLDPLVPQARSNSPQVLGSSEDSEEMWGHWL